MKKIAASLLLLFSLMITLSCNNVSPEKYFDITVLNSNLISGFAGERDFREFDSPSMKMTAASTEPVPMTRQELVTDKIAFSKGAMNKVEALADTEDGKGIRQAALAMYSLVIPAYQNEYSQLAKLYDQHASTDKIEELKRLINEKYYGRFEASYNELIALGKVYASAHAITVNWAKP